MDTVTVDLSPETWHGLKTWDELDNWWRSLAPEERFVMWLRIGQDIGRTRSLEEVSYLYPAPRQLRHVTRQAIHLIEQNALRKLKGNDET